MLWIQSEHIYFLYSYSHEVQCSREIQPREFFYPKITAVRKFLFGYFVTFPPQFLLSPWSLCRYLSLGFIVENTHKMSVNLQWVYAYKPKMWM